MVINNLSKYDSNFKKANPIVVNSMRELKQEDLGSNSNSITDCL